MFNLTGSVGRNGQNGCPEDVLLVQFMLRKLCERMPGTTPEARQPMK
jgi:hypothetical protein